MQNRSPISLALFPIAPFLAFIQSIFNLRNKFNQITFVLFFGLFGYCHTFTDIRADSYRKYEYFNGYFVSNTIDVFQSFLSGGIKDIYESLLFNWVKSFSNDPHILMMFVGLFGGFFYMLVVKRFFNDNKLKHLSWPIAILIVFMVIESNIALMGGIRNFTAFPIVVYSAIRLLLDREKKWFIGLLSTPLIHFGYIPIVVVVLFTYFVKIPNKFLHYACLVVCILSIFISTSSYGGALDTILGYIDNDSISNRIEHYGDSDTELHFDKSLTTRLIRINNKLSACFVALFLIFIRRNRTFLIKTEYEERLYNALLLFVLFGFSLISFSVVGQRYIFVTMILMYLFMLNAYQRCPIKVKSYIYAMPIVYILHIAWFFYNCYCNTGLDIYYQPLPFLLL